MQYLLENKVPSKNQYDISLSDIVLLTDAASFLKLNRQGKCPRGTVDDSFKCSNGSNTNPLELLDSDKNYFTLAEKDAINGYTQLGYHYINDFLRGKSNDDMPVRAIKIQENLDKAFQKAFLPKEMTVYSGLGRSGTDAIKNMKNDLFSYTGYISTSKSLDTSALFASTTEPRILEIRLPKNASAIDLNDQKISANPEEDEVLINTGTIFKRIGIRTEEHKVSSYKNPQKFIIETWQALPRKEIKKIWENDFSGNAIKQYSSYLSEVTDFIKLNYNCPDSEKAGTLAKYYAKTDSIGGDKGLSSGEMTTEIKKVLNGMKTNNGCLDKVSKFMKLNYRCEENPPGSGNFKCDVTKQSDNDLDKRNKLRLKESKVALKEIKAKNQAIRDQMDKVPTNSSKWKSLQQEIDVDREYELEKHIKILSYKHPDVPKEFEQFLTNSDNIIKTSGKEQQKDLDLYIFGAGNAFYQNLLSEVGGKLPESPGNYVKDIIGKRWSFETKKFDPNDSFQMKEYKNALEFLNTQISRINNIDSIINRSKLLNDTTLQTGISSSLTPVINSLNVGDEFEIPTYVSTSRSDTIANGFALRKFTEDKKNYNYNPNKFKMPTMPTVLEIHMKSGSRALALENYALQSQGADAEYVVGDKGTSGTGSQQEVLLARGTTFKVTGITEITFRGKKIKKVMVDGYN